MNGIIIMLIAIAGIVLFSGLETAFIIADKLRIELDRKHKVLDSEIIRLFINHSSTFILAMHVWKIISAAVFITFFHVIYGSTLSNTFSQVTVILLEIIICAFVIFFTTEFVSKALFMANPNLLLRLFSIPALLFFLVFYPFGTFFIFISESLFGVDEDEKEKLASEESVFTGTDLLKPGKMIEQVTEELGTDQQNIAIFRNALEFSNVKLREIMVPRTEIEAVSVNGSVGQLREKFVSTRFSRILAYKDSIDNITGYFEVKDIFRNPDDLKSILRKLPVVPETMTASRLLRNFVNEKRNIALVVDEFGGTSGMVSIEDLLEQIVGDIEDEHDTSDLIEREVNPGEYIFAGRLEIDYLNETYNLDLPEKQDYETLAGMILFYHGSLPQLNDIIKIDNLTIRILRTTSTRIELVNLKKE
jgi:CBS domain containing-hemolysin-like protein